MRDCGIAGLLCHSLVAWTALGRVRGRGDCEREQSCVETEAVSSGEMGRVECGQWVDGHASVSLQAAARVVELTVMSRRRRRLFGTISL
jgi:hypothetical protein